MTIKAGEGWIEVLAPVQDVLMDIGRILDSETRNGFTVLPPPGDTLRALFYPFDKVKVLIVGQDPYPTPGHAMGLSFSVEKDVHPIPKSLVNIFKELSDDMNVDVPNSGDLTPWAEQGVLLLNRVLSVRAGVPNSHKGIGWETLTNHVIRCLAARDKPLVSILWGSNAHSVIPFLGDTPYIRSAHPSPLSAHRGFFGSRPFSRANAKLMNIGASPVDWELR